MTPSPKQATRRLAARMADDASFEDIQYEPYSLQQIECGLAEVAVGQAVSRGSTRFAVNSARRPPQP